MAFFDTSLSLQTKAYDPFRDFHCGLRAISDEFFLPA